MKVNSKLEGIVVVNKPSGMTSHDVVSRARRVFNMKRIGHAGTLDPLATGVLILLLGKATKLFNKFVSFDKGYLATFQLGVKTDSADCEGELINRNAYEHISQEKIEEVFQNYTGQIQQVPPMVSAVKHKGKRLYKLAREGITVEREPRDVTVNRIEIIKFEPPYVQFYLDCSKGTYVRQIADDVGDDLGCGACITQIQRSRVGRFYLEDSVELDDLSVDHVRSWAEFS